MEFYTKNYNFIIVVYNPFNMANYVIISPLDQFEIRNLFSIDTPILGNANLSVTNISLYMTIATFLAFTVSVLATNYSKIAPNK